MIITVHALHLRNTEKCSNFCIFLSSCGDTHTHVAGGIGADPLLLPPHAAVGVGVVAVNATALLGDAVVPAGNPTVAVVDICRVVPLQGRGGFLSAVRAVVTRGPASRYEQNERACRGLGGGGHKLGARYYF